MLTEINDGLRFTWMAPRDPGTYFQHSEANMGYKYLLVGFAEFADVNIDVQKPPPKPRTLPCKIRHTRYCTPCDSSCSARLGGRVAPHANGWREGDQDPTWCRKTSDNADSKALVTIDRIARLKPRQYIPDSF